MARLLIPSSRRPAGQAGFLLPLSVSGALVLLLCSLSMQSLALQTRQMQRLEASRRQKDDLLASAAQQLASALQGRYRCLRPLSSSAWFDQSLPADCPADLDPQQLRNTELWNQRVLLLGWTPSSAGAGVLQLQLEGSRYQRRYGITLTPVYRLQELG